MHYVTAGESHGPQLTAIVYDVPAGLRISQDIIQSDLQRRQAGYGRSARQQIADSAIITSGIWNGKTTGAPVAIVMGNGDAAQSAAQATSQDSLVTPRPGHADLVGALKMNFDECRSVAERASARETAVRVAAASVAREFLASVGVEIRSYVTRIGSVALQEDNPMEQAASVTSLAIETSELRCPDEKTTELMKAAIDEARSAGDSLGGTFRVVVSGLVPGLGSYVLPSQRLTSRLGGALFSIPAIKGVEFGLGFEAACKPGSAVHDAITVDARTGFSRASNNAGGLEGGMSTGMPLIITAAMKPIPTLAHALPSVNIETLEPCDAYTCRADVCAVPSAAVVAEAEVAFVLASAYMEKFGSDSMADILGNLKAYKARLRMISR